MTIRLHGGTDLLVLSALVEGPQHGYVILKRVRSAAGGRPGLQVGALYAVLERLERDELLEVAAEEVVDGRTRRYLRITESGGRALEGHLEQMEAQVTEARARLRSRTDVRPA